MLLMLFTFLFGSVSFAHPGRTASDGCHYCRTNCDSWWVAWNQRHCHWGSTTPSYTPPPVYQPTPTEKCQSSYWSNSYYNSTSNSCDCNYWYELNSAKTYCVIEKTKTPTEECKETYWSNSYYDTTSDVCKCVSWYELNSTKTSCVIEKECKEIYWSNSYYDSTSNACECIYRYERDSAKKDCIKSKIIEEKAKTPTEKCQDKYWLNSYWLESTDWLDDCYCKNWYQWSLNNTSCVLKKKKTRWNYIKDFFN